MDPNDVEDVLFHPIFGNVQSILPRDFLVDRGATCKALIFYLAALSIMYV